MDKVGTGVWLDSHGHIWHVDQRDVETKFNPTPFRSMIDEDVHFYGPIPLIPDSDSLVEACVDILNNAETSGIQTELIKKLERALGPYAPVVDDDLGF